MWDSPAEKSIWPYSHFSSISEIKAAKNFPVRSKFRSELRGDTLPDKSDYAKAAREFRRRRLLPKSNPDKFYSMIDWLRYYNLLDVRDRCSLYKFSN